MIDPFLPNSILLKLEDLKHHKSDFTPCQYQQKLFDLKLKLANSIQPKALSSKQQIHFNNLIKKI